MTTSELRSATMAITGKGRISATRLHGFAGKGASYRRDGRVYRAIRVAGLWYLTGEYTY